MDTPSASRKFALTIYENQKETAGRAASGTFNQLTSIFSKRAYRASKFGRALSPYRLKDGATRNNDSVEFFSMAIADIDDGYELDNLREVLAPYAWIAYSSHNHTSAHHKYRVVLPLSQDVQPSDWPKLWAGLSVFTNGHNDPAVKDLSRIYFLPSCPETAAEDAFFEVHSGELMAPQTLLDLAPVDMPVRDRKPRERLVIPNAFAAAIDYPDSYAEIVADHCATLAHFRDTGAPEEPLWHKCIGPLKHCVDGQEKIHEWSSKYSGYDAAETQQKIDAWNVGPTTCDALRMVSGNCCTGCDRTCKTPLQLGYTIETQPVDLTTIQEVPAASDYDIPKEELLKLVWGEGVRAKEGALFKMVANDESGEVNEVRFSNTVFYGTELVKNEEQEWSLVVEYVARHGELRRFLLPTSHLSAGDKTAGSLAAHTIFLLGKYGRTYAMDHLATSVLQLQYHRREVTTEDAFGWSDSGESFIIGNVEITAEGEKPVRLSDHVKSGGMDRAYGAEGSRNDWVRLVDEVYNRPGAELYQFAFLVSAAAPLINMVGIDGFHGVPVAYTGDGGRGKTTACELACSIWGKGELFKQSSNKGGTTINALLASTAIMRHLPWVMDELTGQKTEEISDMLYALSNGQNKKRLGPSGSFSGKALRWDLFAFITGNMDITGLLATLDRQMAEAVSVRCFEVKVPNDINETVFKGVNFKQLVDKELRANYGVVGRTLIRAYIKNRAKIVALVHKLRGEFQPNTADETRERFYIDLICFAVAAGRVMKKLDLIRFDMDAIQKWAFQNVKALRRARAERQVTSTDIAGEFISWLHDKTIITKHIVDMRTGTPPEMPMDQIRGEPLARKAVQDKRFIVAAKAFQVCGKENGMAPSVIREALEKNGYVVHVAGRDDNGGYNTRLGAGTTRTTGLARCFELDFAKVHGLEADSRDNVVSLHSVTDAAISEVSEAA